MTENVLGRPIRTLSFAVPFVSVLTWFEWAVLALAVTAAAPFLLVAYPPIVDMPNHVARLYLECHRTDPVLARMFNVRAALIPNISMDLANLPLCGLVPPDLVFKGILAGSIGAVAISSVVIQRKAFGGPSVGLLVVPAMAVNLVTFMGYVNYLSGVAVLYVMVAFLIDRIDNRRVLWTVCGVGGPLLLLCHVFALALGMVVVFALQLRRPFRMRQTAVAATQTCLVFLPALVLFAMSEKPQHRLVVHIGSKLAAVIRPVMSGATGWATTYIALVLVATLIILTARRASLAFRPLLAGAAVALLFGLLLPIGIGDAVDVGPRTIAAALPLLAVALPPKRSATGSAVIAALCLALFGLHFHAQISAWPRFSAQVREFRESDEAIPVGAKVLSVWGGPAAATGRDVQAIAYTHLASYAIIDRKAFYPLEFTGRGMQPLSVAPSVEGIASGPSLPLLPETARALAHSSGPVNETMEEAKLGYALSWPQHFDRIIYFHFGEMPNFYPSQLDLVRPGSFFSILSPKPSEVRN